MSIDEKLREIVSDQLHGDTGAIEDIDSLVAQIKQAFRAEGYVPITQELANLQAQTKQELVRLTMTPTPKYKVVNENELKEVMTGQEWYNCFCLETAGQLFPYRTDKEQELVHEVASFFMEAARKASKL